MSDYLRFVGDVHGQLEKYINLVADCPYSLQVGDLSTSERDYALLNELSPEVHRVLAGNHDNYETGDEGTNFVHQTPHFLGDFGVWKVLDKEILFVRGGHSIDWKYRTFGIDFWHAEQLFASELELAIDFYIKTKPEIVVTHECPESIIPYVSGFKTWDGMPIMPSRTAFALEAMFAAHQPKYWFFGHHHRSWTADVNGTTFRCLAELEKFDFQL